MAWVRRIRGRLVDETQGLLAAQLRWGWRADIRCKSRVTMDWGSSIGIERP